MATLTGNRLRDAKPTFDDAAKKLADTGHVDIIALEVALKRIWNLHYKGVEDIMKELVRMPEYELLAARYMEGGPPGPASHFKPILAELYGIEHYNAPDRETKREAFWARHLPSPKEQR